MSKEQKRQAFYTQSPEEVLQAVDATEQGLSSSEAEKRLAEFGHNELKKARNDQSWSNSSSNLRI